MNAAARCQRNPQRSVSRQTAMSDSSKKEGDHNVQVITTIVTSMSESNKDSVEEVSRKLRATIEETTEAEDLAKELTWEEAKQVRLLLSISGKCAHKKTACRDFAALPRQGPKLQSRSHTTTTSFCRWSHPRHRSRRGHHHQDGNMPPHEQLALPRSPSCSQEQG